MATPRTRTRAPARTTWTGGSAPRASYALEPDTHRPEVVVWTEGDEVLASAVVHPSERDAAVVRCLREALARAKSPPDAVKVRDAATADLVRPVLGESVTVRVAKTPELRAMAEAVAPPDDDPSIVDSYLVGGRVDAAVVGSFFSAAAELFRAAPWNVIADDSVMLAFDAPSLDVRDAAVIVTGQRGLGRGVLMFASPDDFLAWQRAAVDEDGAEGEGAELFAISYADAISDRRLAEIDAHGWELAAPGLGAFGVPVLTRADRDGVIRPLTTHDVLIGLALSRTLTRMVSAHSQRLAASDGPSVTATFPESSKGTSPVASLALPHPGARAFDAVMAPHRAVSVIMREFLASDVRGRVPGVWRDVADELGHALLTEKFEGSGAAFSRWPMRHVDEAMARVAEALAEPRAHRIAVDALAHLFAWLVDTNRLARPTAEKLHERAQGHLDAAASAHAATREEPAADEPALDDDDGTVDGEVLPPGIAEWARSAIRDARS